MANRTSRKSRQPNPEVPAPATGVWSWLQKPANQKTLRFIGAGIVAAIGLLVTVGFIHKPEESASKASSAISASQLQPAPTQSATASGGGNATNINGSGNLVGTGKP